MDKKVIIGIVAAILVIVVVLLGNEVSKENKLKKQNESDKTSKTKLATSYTYDFYEEKSYKSNGIEMKYVVKKVGKDIEAGTYLMKANIGVNPSFMIIISDVYQDNPDMLPRNLWRNYKWKRIVHKRIKRGAILIYDWNNKFKRKNGNYKD